MLAAKLFGPEDIRVLECPIPEIGEDELLLKTSAAALCGSDLRMIANGYEGVDAVHPLTLGHEVSGVIEKVGKNVTDYHPGMRIAIAPNYGCGVCDECVRGDTHLCADYQAFGINMDGGFAEYMRVPSRLITQGNLMVLSQDFPMEVAAILEPFSCVLNGQERANVHLNDTVLVIGAGPIGVMHAMLAKALGASKVMIRDMSLERMLNCKQIDPWFITVPEENLTQAVMRHTNGRGVDVCITACPSVQAQADALQLMAMCGRVLYFGGLPVGNDQVTLHTNLIHYRQLQISGSTRTNTRQYREVAKMLAAGRIDLAPIITTRYPLFDFKKAVENARKGQGLKTVIEFGKD
ncbi:MAG: alcohol dehydrogenase catalytic domain-containing protein [Eubacteriales bacterium]|nr:alcohol dehydrogenase catalytic domain-containing protein [Eubacteriales bacterium]